MVKYRRIFGLLVLILGTMMGLLFHAIQFTCIPLTECIGVSGIGSILTIICLPFIKSLQPKKLAFFTTAIYCAAICLLTVLLISYIEGPKHWFYSLLILPTWVPLSWLLFPLLLFSLKLFRPISQQDAQSRGDGS